MSIPSWVKVGAKVVCVDDSLPTDFDPETQTPADYPPMNVPLVIGSIVTHPLDATCVTIEGYPNMCERYQKDVGYRVWRFRPLITIQQDIALFHELCPGLPVVPPSVVPPRVPVTTPSGLPR